MPPASPPGADPAWPADAIEVGRIVDAWGVKGWLKVQPFAADPQALFSSKRWFLLPSEKAVAPRPGVAPLPSLLKITQAKEHGDVVVALAQGVEDRAGAEALRGTRVFVGRSSFPTAGPDEFYWVDLIGLTVVNREAVTLGTVAGLIDTGPHSVLRVMPVGEGAEERLIPFVAAYVDDVSLARKLITVDWGLDY
ncbi:MAG TPA: ribosome maturation factor RimM [Burkholderiaceae bacterium]|nr:ribosome maturation factor RimM [Burkholderiaceae bacterium]